MYFKKLEIFGFKSFAEKTVLNFEEGITAIVGPNGCGKSNVFDSIRWVLGEQSIKQLRGSSKEDIIFNGTQSKPALSMAEVSLTFSNQSRPLPIEYDEVTVTRKLFRSGESEYLLNKTQVRLKDIQELFMGTGIGSAAYSLIPQGKVDLVVSAKPEERRSIFDEASGITKYKAKKKEALNKLKATEDNLLRVNDIVTEVKRQITSCERQANKARKYKEEFEKLKDLEFRMARFQMSQYTGKKERLTQKIRQHQRRLEELTVQHEQAAQALSREINVLSEVEQQINDINARQIKLDGQIDINNRQIGFNHERIETLTQTGIRQREQKEQLIERCRQQQEKIEGYRQALEKLQAASLTNKERLRQKRDELAALESLIEEARQRITDDEDKILSFMAHQERVRDNLTEVMKTVQNCLARKKRLELELEKVSQEKQECDQRLQNIGYQINTIEGSIHDLRAERVKKEEVITHLKERLRHTNDTINSKEKESVFLKSQKAFIQQMTTQYKGMPNPIMEGRMIVDSKPQQNHSGIIGKVTEVVPLEQTIPTLFEFRKQPAPKPKYEITCEFKFVELDQQKLIDRIESIQTEITDLLRQKNELEEILNVEQEVLQEFGDEIFAKEKTRSILEAQKDDISAGARKLLDELSIVDQETVEVEQTLTDAKAKEQEFTFELETINQEIEWCQNDIKEKQRAINTRAQERENVSVTIAQIETEVQSEQEKINDQQDNLRMFSEALDNWLEEIQKIDEDLTKHDSKHQEYQREIEELTAKIQQLRTEKDSTEEVLRDCRSRKEELTGRIKEIRGQLTAAEDELETIKRSLHEMQMEAQELEFSEKGIKDRLLQSYRIDYDEMLAGLPANDSEENPFNPEQAETELTGLRKRCESFGNVNLDAMDEYEGLKERYEFLTQQQADLLEAKSQLLSTISKINRSTRQMFMDTFNKVSEEFRIYFRMLFGGGEAQLILLDPENVLESGIDIIARPPGKKLQNISLLSGGEKTLTAIALIFGVFKVNPSPFCVLDEIDAALDESNVGRFSYLLQEFAKIAQFIVITHNKKTIASSDVMYGITMPDTGISKVVSVKFAEDEKKPQTAAEAAAV